MINSLKRLGTWFLMIHFGRNAMPHMNMESLQSQPRGVGTFRDFQEHLPVNETITFPLSRMRLSSLMPLPVEALMN